MIDVDDIRSAAARIGAVAHRTPVFRSRSMDEFVGARVFLKAETFQRTEHRASPMPNRDTFSH
jgi:threo-3-hydroxy-L-aspartate ammonia-lyase